MKGSWEGFGAVDVPKAGRGFPSAFRSRLGLGVLGAGGISWRCCRGGCWS